MDEKSARYVLGIDNEIQITADLLKRQYRINALRYHPDKNSSPHANEQFHLVRDAYDYLSDNNSPIDNLSYAEMLREFLNTKSPVIQIIITKLSHMCEDNAIRLINSIDKLILIDIYKLLIVHQEILYIPNIFIEEINKILVSKTKGDECILLNPSLEDLLNDNVYKLSINEYTFFVPLWHDELIYDNSGCDLYVKCIPVLPDNVKIDDNNNIIVMLKYKISDIFQTDVINVLIGDHNFQIRVDELRLMKRQILTRRGVGISRIISKNVYDVSNKGNISFDIELT
jgi:hypothetical protein